MLAPLKVVGLVPLLVMCIGCGDDLRELAGEWHNYDGDTDGVVSMKIHFEDAKANVQVWGNCKPTSCDWGEAEAYPYSTTRNTSHDRLSLLAHAELLAATFETDFSENHVIIRPAFAGALNVQVWTRYTDARPLNNHIAEYKFVR